MAGKKQLVVIGNGMAGARAVEDVLARGGADQFDITMFGDEPYGNYNRILLSNVLSGKQDATEIFLSKKQTMLLELIKKCLMIFTSLTLIILFWSVILAKK